jgi:hypothetical protein
MIAVIPVLADQTAIGEIKGNGNTQKIYNIEKTTIEHQNVHVDETVDAHTTNLITVQQPQDTRPYIDGLAIDNVNETILMYPNEVLVYRASGYETFSISSGTPIAVYSIEPYTEYRIKLDSSESMLTYDPVYHRFIHGSVVPTAVFPHFTTRCWFSPSVPGYIVLDNRYFPDYSLVSIQSI